MYINIVSYLYGNIGKHIKSKMGNKLYLRMIFICVRLNRLHRHDCHTMTLKIETRDKTKYDPLAFLKVKEEQIKQFKKTE